MSGIPRRRRGPAPGRAVGAGVLAAAAGLLVAWPSPAAAQSPIPEMVEGCVSDREEFRAACEDAALVLQAAHGGLGLLASGGGALPASASTASWRPASRIRLVLDGGVTVSRIPWPEPDRSLGEGLGERRTFQGIRLAASVGFFGGFSPRPGVDGVLAVDGVGSFRYLQLRRRDGFGGYPRGWGGGVGIGLLRESASLPGATLTVLRHRLDRIRFNGRVQREDGEEQSLTVDLAPRVTSVRAEVGKELPLVRLTVGGVWDRYGGEGWIRAAREGAGIGFAPPEIHDLSANRTYLFLGTSRAWEAAEVAAELAWAGAPSGLVELDGTGPFRPDSRSLQSVFTVRLVY